MTDILLKKIEENADSVFNEKDACRNYVYILQCRDNSLYTGWTNDIGKRVGMEKLKPVLFPLLAEVLRADGQTIDGIYERNDEALRAKE